MKKYNVFNLKRKIKEAAIERKIKHCDKIEDTEKTPSFSIRIKGLTDRHNIWENCLEINNK